MVVGRGFDTSGLKGRFYEPLTKEELYKVHVASLKVLENTGVKVYAPEAVDILKKAGCDVDAKRDTVRIPQYLVKESIMKSPNAFTLCGRSKEWDLPMGSGKFHACWAGGVPYIHDLDSGERREGTKKDIVDTTRFIDAMDNIHFFMAPVVVPTDVPEKTIEVHAAEAALSNTSKHVTTEIWSKERIRDVIRIGEIVAGGEEELRKRPLISALSQPVSPLQHNELQTAILLEFARKGLPITIRAHPISGLSSPVTIAGELLMVNAENLSSLVIAQLTNPGTPVIYGMSASVADMRIAMNLSGTVEIGLLGAALVQMAKYYGLPSSYSAGIDSPVPDAQASTELIVSAMPGVFAGIDDLWLCANDLKYTFWYEQMLIDDNIMAIIQRLLKGVEVSDETLGLGLIDEVGPGGGFLNKRHTMLYYPKEHVIPRLFARAAWSDWEKAGGRDILRRANEKAREILKTHQPQALERDIQDQMTQAVKEVDKRA